MFKWMETLTALLLLGVTGWALAQETGVNNGRVPVPLRGNECPAGLFQNAKTGTCDFVQGNCQVGLYSMPGVKSQREGVQLGERMDCYKPGDVPTFIPFDQLSSGSCPSGYTMLYSQFPEGFWLDGDFKRTKQTGTLDPTVDPVSSKAYQCRRNDQLNTCIAYGINTRKEIPRIPGTDVCETTDGEVKQISPGNNIETPWTCPAGWTMAGGGVGSGNCFRYQIDKACLSDPYRPHNIPGTTYCYAGKELPDHYPPEHTIGYNRNANYNDVNLPPCISGYKYGKAETSLTDYIKIRVDGACRKLAPIQCPAGYTQVGETSCLPEPNYVRPRVYWPGDAATAPATPVVRGADGLCPKGLVPHPADGNRCMTRRKPVSESAPDLKKYEPTAAWDLFNELGKLFDSVKDEVKGINLLGSTSSSGAYGGPLVGQGANLYAGGSMSSRAPTKSYSLAHVRLPGMRAGCGGIDVWAGSFSFMNEKQFVAMLENIGQNAIGYATQLLISTISQQMNSELKDVFHKIMMMNNLNISSCEAAQALVDGAVGLAVQSNHSSCQNTTQYMHITGDRNQSRAACNESGPRILKNARDHAKPHEERTIAATVPHGNYVWDALNRITQEDSVATPMNHHDKEMLMSLVGTVVYFPPLNSPKSPGQKAENPNCAPAGASGTETAPASNTGTNPSLPSSNLSGPAAAGQPVPETDFTRCSNVPREVAGAGHEHDDGGLYQTYPAVIRSLKQLIYGHAPTAAQAAAHPPTAPATPAAGTTPTPPLPNATLKVYRCKEVSDNGCLRPVIVDAVSTKPLNGIVKERLHRIANNIRDGKSQEDDDRAFINITSLPVYRMLAIATMKPYLGLDHTLITQYTDLIAIDYAESFMSRALHQIDAALNHHQSRSTAEENLLNRLRTQVRDQIAAIHREKLEKLAEVPAMDAVQRHLADIERVLMIDAPVAVQMANAFARQAAPN